MFCLRSVSCLPCLLCVSPHVVVIVLRLCALCHPSSFSVVLRRAPSAVCPSPKISPRKRARPRRKHAEKSSTNNSSCGTGSKLPRMHAFRHEAGLCTCAAAADRAFIHRFGKSSTARTLYNHRRTASTIAAASLSTIILTRRSWFVPCAWQQRVRQLDAFERF